jgi:endonuclease/exonuclease/phosphatase family metal-dependent hydrolase
MSYIIGSFNTRNFTGVGKHDINKMAEIIKGERFDIVALQEILRPEALSSLLKRLPGWAGKQEQPHSLYQETDHNADGESTGNNQQTAERKNAAKGFAFLWNAQRFKECSKSQMPKILNDIVPKGKLARIPLYGRFTPSGLQGGAFIEIRLINIHLWWGSGLPMDKETRLNEYNYILGCVHTKLSKHRYGNNMAAYTIILGDYNMTLIYLGKKIIDFENIEMITDQSSQTTLSQEKYVNDYDHVSYDKKRFVGVNANISRVDSVEKYSNSDFCAHKTYISDHAPIKLELNLNPMKEP